MSILGEGADPNLPRCKKKKLLRIEKKLAKNPNSVITTAPPQQKSLEDFIAENNSVSTVGVQKLRVSYQVLGKNCIIFIIFNFKRFVISKQGCLN